MPTLTFLRVLGTPPNHQDQILAFLIKKADHGFDSTLCSQNVVPHPSSMNYEKVGIFDSTLRPRKVAPRPSRMICEKRQIV